MIKEYVVSYKYKDNPWRVYEKTRVSSWAESQFKQMKIDHPGAEYRIIPAPKSVHK